MPQEPDIGPSSKLPPNQAFAGFPAGFEEDENGDIKFNPVGAAFGVAGILLAKKEQGKTVARIWKKYIQTKPKGEKSQYYKAWVQAWNEYNRMK